MGLAGLLWSSGGAADAQQAPVEPTPMIVRIDSPRYIGQPAMCPGDTDETVPDAESICIAELYQGPGRRVRHIAGPELRNGDPFRLTMSHMRISEYRGLTLLVLAVPFKDQGVSGNFAYWWMRPEADGAYCLEASFVTDMESGPLRRAFEAGAKRRSGEGERAEVRCVHG